MVASASSYTSHNGTVTRELPYTLYDRYLSLRLLAVRQLQAIRGSAWRSQTVTSQSHLTPPPPPNPAASSKPVTLDPWAFCAGWLKRVLLVVSHGLSLSSLEKKLKTPGDFCCYDIMQIELFYNNNDPPCRTIIIIRLELIYLLHVCMRCYCFLILYA